MEKRTSKNRTDNIIKIVIIGPESTGKTDLAQSLAEHYNTIWIPEYAREYIENLNRPYEYSDIEIIAKKQVQQEKEYIVKAKNILFLDTDLIITKVWFDVVYKKCPEWIVKEIAGTNIKLYLLCNTNIEWKPDPVRENEKLRGKLFSTYKKEIEHFGFQYKIISGKGNKRLDKAIKFVDNLLMG